MNEVLVIPTERDKVILRQLTVEDAECYFVAVDSNREHLSQFGDTTSEKYPTIESVVDSIERPQNPSKVRLVIWDDDQFVGSINLTPEGETAEIGYWLDDRFTGNGYATLATKALAGYALRSHDSVVAEVVEGNQSSANVLERSGFKRTAQEAGRILFEFQKPELVADDDFELQLDRAFAEPLILTLKGRPDISPEEIEEREAYYARQAGLPYNIKIKSYDTPPQIHEVTTDDPEKYLTLLAQAKRRLEATIGSPDPGLRVTPELEKTSEHELQHGEMANYLGVNCRYGVRILHDPKENIWALGPFHALVGNSAGVIMLTRLEEAAILLAPDTPSQGDIQSARALGFTDREETLKLFNETYPSRI